MVTAGTSAANTKMNKSGILKKAIDKIRSLDVENIELRLENQRLKQVLGAHTMPDMFEAPLSPPTSDSSSPRPQAIEHANQNRNAIPSIESDQKILFIQRGVSPHAKFALCMIMFCIVSLNSFGSLIALNDRPNAGNWNDGNDGNAATTARRTILSNVMDDVSPVACKIRFVSAQLTQFSCGIVFVLSYQFLAIGDVLQLEQCHCLNTQLSDYDRLPD